MKKKIIALISTMILTTLTLTGCTEEEIANYVVVGGISEPTRVWNEVVETETPTDEVTTEEKEYVPDVLPMEPTTFITNKTADTLTSDKDGEVVETFEEGTELVLVGTTGKGYYQTEDGAFISASDVDKMVADTTEDETTTTGGTTTTTTTQPTTTTTTQNNTTPTQDNQTQPTQQTAEAPTEQEQPQPVQQEEPAPAPTPQPEPAPAPAPEPAPAPAYEVHCGICGAVFSSDEECDAHYYSAHADFTYTQTQTCSHPNAYWDSNGMEYCPDCQGYIEH